MSSSASFTEAVENVVRLAQASSKLSMTAQIKVLSDLENALSSPSAQQNILDEIDDLALAAIECNRSFNRILLTFTRIIADGADGELKLDMEALINKWTATYNKYHGLLQRSSDVAADAEQAARAFNNEYLTVLLDSNVPIRERKLMTKTWMETVTRHESKAHTTHDEFLSLRIEVQQSYTEWARIVREFDLSDEISVSSLAGREMSPLVLGHSFSQMTLAIFKLSSALDVCSSGGVLGALGVLSPHFYCSTFAEVLGNDPRMSQLKTSVEMLAIQDQRMNGNQSSQYTTSTLSPSIEEFNVVTSRLEAFQNVWAMIRVDLQMVAEKLDYASGTASERLFTARLRIAAKAYEVLGDVCNRYKKAIAGQL
ncbi:hypothetical protein EIP91_004432 [Steccherinum ochraceum]|uniref:Uncharacterized protein n=1 Tax=Steccherinum ochraceum TaxID=92696 RepID=A0A4R0RHC5_9APHY|nr:hypothetical protein EIP91_004432 [Steccherinum ochraceum]